MKRLRQRFRRIKSTKRDNSGLENDTDANVGLVPITASSTVTSSSSFPQQRQQQQRSSSSLKAGTQTEPSKLMCKNSKNIGADCNGGSILSSSSCSSSSSSSFSFTRSFITSFSDGSANTTKSEEHYQKRTQNNSNPFTIINSTSNSEIHMINTNLFSISNNTSNSESHTMNDLSIQTKNTSSTNHHRPRYHDSISNHSSTNNLSTDATTISNKNELSNDKNDHDLDMSIGSSHPEDSFIIMENSFSSLNSSFNSFYSYNPYTGVHENNNNSNGDRRPKPQTTNKNDTTRDRNNSNDTGNDTTMTSQHYLHKKQTTRHLPRLTVPSSARTQALLEKKCSKNTTFSTKKEKRRLSSISHNSSNNNSPIVSPNSMSTTGTEPVTPISFHSHDDGDDDDFPIASPETTPQFHIPVNPPSQRQQRPFQSQRQNSTRTTTPLVSFHDSNTNKSNPIAKSTSSSSYYHCYDSNASTTSSNTNTTSSSFNSTKIMSKEHRMNNAATVEQNFWRDKLKCTIEKFGIDSIETARDLNHLGSVLLRCKEYKEALIIYKRTVAIYRHYHGDDSLVVARVLDKVGLSATQCSITTRKSTPSSASAEGKEHNYLDWAFLALNEALHVRITHLGPHHCDTVDTLNNIGGVFLHKKDWKRAKETYLDVLIVRASIFGNNHASVAVTAQTLGVVCSHLSQFESSLKYFQLALSIYRQKPMQLKESHPLIKKSLRNIDRIDRLMISLGKNRRHHNNQQRP